MKIGKITKLEIPGGEKLESKPEAKANTATVRFAQLVKESGRPEVMVFLTDPKKNRPFMARVKENRVITVIQNPTSKRKDFGYIGFHPQPFAVFLVFPKKLKAGDLTQIIGIKYELLQMQEQKVESRKQKLGKAEIEKSGKGKQREQKSQVGDRKSAVSEKGIETPKTEKSKQEPKVRPAPKPEPKSEPEPEPKKPVEKSFTVRIRRTLIQELRLEVTGKNAREARVKALEVAEKEDLPVGTEKVVDRVVELNQKVES